jgi:hypothetical protein
MLKSVESALILVQPNADAILWVAVSTSDDGKLGHMHPQGNNLPQTDVHGADCQILGCPTLISTCKVSACISKLKTEIKYLNQLWFQWGPKSKLRSLKSIGNSAQPKANLVPCFSSSLSTSTLDHPIFGQRCAHRGLPNIGWCDIDFEIQFEI